MPSSILLRPIFGDKANCTYLIFKLYFYSDDFRTGSICNKRYFCQTLWRGRSLEFPEWIFCKHKHSLSYNPGIHNWSPAASVLVQEEEMGELVIDSDPEGDHGQQLPEPSQHPHDPFHVSWTIDLSVPPSSIFLFWQFWEGYCTHVCDFCDVFYVRGCLSITAFYL